MKTTNCVLVALAAMLPSMVHASDTEAQPFLICVDAFRIQAAELTDIKISAVEGAARRESMDPLAFKGDIRAILADVPGAIVSETLRGCSQQPLGSPYPFEFSQTDGAPIGGYTTTLSATPQGYSLSVTLEIPGQQGARLTRSIPVAQNGGRAFEWLPTVMPDVSYVVRIDARRLDPVPAK